MPQLTEREFICHKYNDGMTYQDIAQAFTQYFQRPINKNAVRKRIRRYEDNGWLEFEDKPQGTDFLEDLGEPSDSFLSVAVWDIETTGLWADFGYILVAVVKDLHLKRHHIFRLDEYFDYNSAREINSRTQWSTIDKELCHDLRSCLLKFDIVVTYNGRDFDTPFLDTRLLKHKLDPLPKQKAIDLYQIAKWKVRLRSKKLDALKEYLGIDTDVTGHDWEYWQMAGAGIPVGYDYVVDHCVRDVDRLEQVAQRLKRHILYIK